MQTRFSKSSVRKLRIELLQERMARLLDKDFPAAYKSDSPSEALLRIRREERLIETELAILRLLQGEDRLANNLLIPILSSASLIIGAVVGYFLKLNI